MPTPLVYSVSIETLQMCRSRMTGRFHAGHAPSHPRPTFPLLPPLMLLSLLLVLLLLLLLLLLFVVPVGQAPRGSV